MGMLEDLDELLGKLQADRPRILPPIELETFPIFRRSPEPVDPLKFRVRWEAGVGIDKYHIIRPVFPIVTEDFSKRLYRVGNQRDVSKVEALLKLMDVEIQWHEDKEYPDRRGWVERRYREDGCWTTNIIHLNRDWANVFTLIHELGHLLIGPVCCDAHEEWLVYGFVKVVHQWLDLQTPMDLGCKLYRDQHILDMWACGDLKPYDPETDTRLFLNTR